MGTDTTSIFGLRYPDGAEAPNVPLWLGNLANDVDASSGAGVNLAVPPLGTGWSINSWVGKRRGKLITMDFRVDKATTAAEGETLFTMAAGARPDHPIGCGALVYEGTVWRPSGIIIQPSGAVTVLKGFSSTVLSVMAAVAYQVP
jgi:hypothetical protein